MSEMNLLQSLYPMGKYRLKNQIPEIFVLLQKKRNLIENMIGVDTDKEVLEKLNEEFKNDMSQKKKKSNQINQKRIE